MKALMILLLLTVPFCAFAQNGSDLDPDDLSSDQVLMVLGGDLFRLFSGDLDSYDTELKRKNFLKTDAGKAYVEHLNALKERVTNGIITDTLFQNSVTLSAYDIKKQGFWMTVGRNWGMGAADASYRFSLAGVNCDKLPIVENVIGSAGPKSAEYLLFFPCDEETGQKIEELNTDYRDPGFSVRIRYSCLGVQSKKIIVYTISDGTQTWTAESPYTKAMTVEIINKDTKDVLIKKTFG